jgi:hypothetical protein
VASRDAVTNNNVPAKQAEVDGINMLPGDVIRAYATYAAKGYACDTPIHTFNAPEPEELHNMRVNAARQQMGYPATMRRQQMNPRGYDMIDQFDSMGADDVIGSQSAVCPSIALDQEVLKIAGLDNTYVLVSRPSRAEELRAVRCWLVEAD